MSKHLSRRERKRANRERSRSAILPFEKEIRLIQLLNEQHTWVRSRIEIIRERLRWFFLYRGTFVNLNNIEDVIGQVIRGSTENQFLLEFIKLTLEACYSRAQRGVSASGWDGNLYCSSFRFLSAQLLVSEVNEEHNGMGIEIVKAYGELLKSVATQWKKVNIIGVDFLQSLGQRSSTQPLPGDPGANIFNYDVNYAPLLIQQPGERIGHWVLLNIMPRSRKIRCYDSGNQGPTTALRDHILDKIQLWVEAWENKMKSKNYWQGSQSEEHGSWEKVHLPCLKQQRDNCGWHMLFNLKTLSLDLGACGVERATHNDIETFQSLIFYEFAFGTVFPFPTPSEKNAILFNSSLFPKMKNIS